MPLRYVLREDRYHCPVVVCDHCGDEIGEARDGNAQWVMCDRAGAAGGVPVYFTHKRCCHAWERAHPEESMPEAAGDPHAIWGAEELQVWLVHLERNAKLDRRRAESQARALAMIG